ncbi:MAG: hypothetical protein VB108_02475 [Anaerolineaceae bacterium]|nr:hypothetical protein [Anaerolineaceae bacterium]
MLYLFQAFPPVSCCFANTPVNMPFHALKEALSPKIWVNGVNAFLSSSLPLENLKTGSHFQGKWGKCFSLPHKKKALFGRHSSPVSFGSPHSFNPAACFFLRAFPFSQAPKKGHYCIISLSQ